MEHAITAFRFKSFGNMSKEDNLGTEQSRQSQTNSETMTELDNNEEMQTSTVSREKLRCSATELSTETSSLGKELEKETEACSEGQILRP